MQLTNWAGTVVFRPERFARPRSVDEVQGLVAAACRVRVLGSGHSFTEVAQTDGLLVSLADLPAEIDVDTAAGTVRVGGGMRYSDLFGPLDAAGVALHNTGSLPHISVAGACATGTHGSGGPCLAAGVTAIELVGPGGAPRTITADDPEFDGSVVALGLLGVVTALTLRTRPTYAVRQYVYEDLPLDALVEDFDGIMDSAYSVSAFTRWRGPLLETLWRKQLADAPEPPARWHGARLATTTHHPIPGHPTESSTDQLGVPGPWHARLPHFRLDFTPSSGREIQTEYLLPRTQAARALRALDGIRDAIAPALHVSEIRTVAADPLWLSPAHGRASVGIHFTWVDDVTLARAAVAAVERALESCDVRPHWGKVFGLPRARVRDAYPRLDEFEALVRRHDPAGVFTNDFVRGYLDVGGS